MLMVDACISGALGGNKGQVLWQSICLLTQGWRLSAGARVKSE